MCEEKAPAMVKTEVVKTEPGLYKNHDAKWWHDRHKYQSEATDEAQQCNHIWVFIAAIFLVVIGILCIHISENTGKAPMTVESMSIDQLVDRTKAGLFEFRGSPEFDKEIRLSRECAHNTTKLIIRHLDNLIRTQGPVGRVRIDVIRFMDATIFKREYIMLKCGRMTMKAIEHKLSFLDAKCNNAAFLAYDPVCDLDIAFLLL